MVISKRVVKILVSILIMIVCCKPKEQQESVTENSRAVLHLAANNIVPLKMVHLPAGTFQMGTNDPAFPDANPVHKVFVKEFWMDEHEVTNAEFERFVKATIM